MPRMPVDPNGEKAARSAAIGGAAVGLALAAALLSSALLSGGLPARGDLPDFFWPMKAYTAERWLAGGVPLWNPLSGGGEPWLAQLQSGALYPGDAPFLLGLREGALLGIAFHLALAAAGAAFWLWELGASRPAALLAAGLFAGGGAYLSLVPVYNNACTAAWLPWLFALARRVVIGRSRGAGFAVAVAGAFLAGEPALAAAGAVAALLLALWAGAEGEPPVAAQARARAASRAVLPFVAGLLLASAALLPFASLVGSSGRLSRTTRAEAVARAAGPSDLADLVAPPLPEATRTGAPGRGGYLVTLALGPLPLLLAAGAGAGLPGRRRLLGGLGVLGAGAFLVALGAAGLLAPLLWDVGLLRGLRFPARWFVFTHLALAVAAGAGLDGWLWGRFRAPTDPATDGREEAEQKARARSARFALAAGFALFLVAAALAAGVPEARAVRDPARTIVGSAAALLGLAAIAAARLRSAPPSHALAAAVAAAAVVPLPWLAGEALAAVPARTVVSRPLALEGVARGPGAGRVFAPAALDRTLALGWKYGAGAEWGEASVSRAANALAGYSNLFHGVATIGTASPIGDPRAERLLGAALAGGDPARILALLDARHVLTPFAAQVPGLRLETERGGLRRYAVPGTFGRAFFPLESREAGDDEAFAALARRGFDPGRTALVAPAPGSAPLPPPRPRRSWAAARFVADGPERAEIETSASAPSLLVLTRTWDPGWVARVDGEEMEVRRAQLALLAVVVPAGEHRLELAYRPGPFRLGLLLSGVGLLAVVGLALAGPPGRRT